VYKGNVSTYEYANVRTLREYSHLLIQYVLTLGLKIAHYNAYLPYVLDKEFQLSLQILQGGRHFCLQALRALL